jgi:transposase
MLRRLEWVGETLRCTLNHLAMVAPDWLHDYITPDWIDRYAPRFDHTRLPKNAAECEDLATTIGANGVHLLQAINDPRTPSWIRNLPAIHMLREVWLEEYDVRDLVDGAVRLRDRADMPEDALLADTRYDPEAR